jgi:cytochrome c oxidase subunit III
MSSIHAHHADGALPLEPEKATLAGRNKILGFWLFLGGETVLFGTLFATFIALRNQVPEGPTAKELFQVGMVAVATFILLASSLTSVLAMMSMHRRRLGGTLAWLGVTIALGGTFLGLEIYEFNHYVHEGHTFTSSAFATSFYTLVGFHGAHVAFGVLWIGLLIFQGLEKGLTVVTAP